MISFAHVEKFMAIDTRLKFKLVMDAFPFWHK